MNDFTKDYYAIFNLDPNSTQEDIRSAYIRFSKTNHPDFGGSNHKMQEINEAYAVLRNPVLRARYDHWYFLNVHKVVVNTLDYDAGYQRVSASMHSFSFDVSKYLYNQELYAYTTLENGKKVTVIIDFDDFVELYKIYTAKEIRCNIVDEPFHIYYDKTVPVNELQNNHLQFLQLHDDRFYCKKEHGQYVVIGSPAWHYIEQRIAARRKSGNRFIKIAASCAAVLFFVGVTIWDAGRNQKNNIPLTQTNAVPLTQLRSSPPKKPTPTPKTYPIPSHNSVYAFAGRDPNFEIKTSSSSSTNSFYYYMKIVDHQSGELVQSVFIHAGKTANVFVPYGNYDVKWVSGDRWYGYEDYFLNSSAQKADETFLFNEETGWSVTLYPVQHGNLETDTIDIDDF